MQIEDIVILIGSDLIDSIAFTAAAIIMAAIASFVLKQLFRSFRNNISRRGIIPMSFIGKSNTINSILFSLIDVTVYSITLLIILSHWNVNISPILTGAGIAGLALSFGSQTLIKDVIAGFFVLAENQFNVGDRIRVDDKKYEGTVVRITLRITVLRDDNGNKIFLPNSQMNAVTLIANPEPKKSAQKKA